MRLVHFILTVVVLFMIAPNDGLAQARRTDAQPPVAQVKPRELTEHGETRVDNYFWLREREDPEVITYLEAENEYTAAMLAHTDGLQDLLFEEIRSRIKQDDSSVPYSEGNYFYYTRYVKGGEYPLYCRKKGSLDADEEIMLDVKMAVGHEYYAVS